MTALPVKNVIPPDQALLFVQEVRDRLSIVTLNEGEYHETIQQAANADSPVDAFTTRFFCDAR